MQRVVDDFDKTSDPSLLSVLTDTRHSIEDGCRYKLTFLHSDNQPSSSCLIVYKENQFLALATIRQISVHGATRVLCLFGVTTRREWCGVGHRFNICHHCGTICESAQGTWLFFLGSSIVILVGRKFLLLYDVVNLLNEIILYL